METTDADTLNYIIYDAASMHVAKTKSMLI